MTDPTLDEMLETAKQREEDNKKILAMKALDKLYEENSDCLKQLAEIERKELEDWLKYEPLTEEKKQELVEFRKSRQQQYLQDREECDPWIFLSSWNIETGCGNSVSILMTQALASEPEYHNNPENPCEITTTKEYGAERKFRQIFGDYDANFLEFHTREEFFEKWSDYIPKALLTVNDSPCYIEFFMRLHYNFS